MPTIKDIAEYAGVSHGAVSNANEIKVLDMQISKVQGGKEIVAILNIKVKRHSLHSEIIHLLSSIEGLKFIEEI